jgi:hypothetical protein
MCEIKKVGASPVRVKLIEIREEQIEIEENGKIVKYGYSDLEYVKMIPSNSSSLDKILILKNKTYIRGEIIYINEGIISLERSSHLKILNAKDVVNIVDPTVFKEEMSKSRETALYWSFLYPGLGQIYTSGREWAGIAFALSFSTSALMGVYFYRQGIDYYSLYKESRYKNKDYYNKHAKSMNIAEGLAAVAIGIYVWSLFDAYINFRYRYDIEARSKNLNIEFSRRY